VADGPWLEAIWNPNRRIAMDVFMEDVIVAKKKAAKKSAKKAAKKAAPKKKAAKKAGKKAVKKKK